MKYNNDNIINCIYGNNDNLICKNFNPNNNFEIIDNSPSYTDFIYSGCKYFNSIVLPGNDKIILCSFSSSSYIHCYKYDILSNMIIKSVKIDIELTPISHKNFFVEYFYETDEILIGSTDYSSNIFISQCSIELQCSDIQKTILTENNLIFNGANIIIPFDKSNYYIMAYYEGSSLIDYLFNLNLNISPINPLNCSNYYNYDQTECIDSIPEGYYCNNTLLKTIDKCHENCKTCKKGPTSINNNCLSCPSSGKKYYDLGNCTDDCVYGYFNMITDKVCKCSSNIKCYYCTEYSIQYDLCEVCNNDAGFYQKIDDERRSDKFINCYSNIEYYYYLQNKKYYPCYSTCKTCNENGTNIENNCTSCRDGYEFKNDLENDKNCYEICSKYYYYDSDNNYHCINICPHDYKLISDKKRCINDCSNDNIYKYEFNNHCYRECPNGTIISTDNIYKCEGDLICEENYYNYEHKECYSSIPDGYYLNEDDKTIDKCHENCKTCDEGPTNDNNNCKECQDSLFFDLGNCVTSCNNGILISEVLKTCKCSLDIKCRICSKETYLSTGKCLSCNTEEEYYPKNNDEDNTLLLLNCYNNETISDGYYLNKTFFSYEPCYNTCEKCSGFGDENNNNCDECKSGYSFMNNDKNCYQNCNYYFYFDSSQRYHCTENCPSGYKPIRL